MKTFFYIICYLFSIPLFSQSNNIEKTIYKNINFSLSTQLGEYLSIKDHPKAKGVNLKIQVPVGWEVREGDRPNIVKKFVNGDDVYLIQIRDNVTFFSRKQSRETIQKDNFVNDLIQKENAFLKNLEVLEQSIVTIDTYPAIQSKVKGDYEQMGFKVTFIMKSWIIFYEDKYIILQSMGGNNSNFYENEQLYSLITNSVIFPEHYK
jgi:hypothetical protein